MGQPIPADSVKAAGVLENSARADVNSNKEVLMKKKIMAAILIFAMCFAFAGCGAGG